MAFGQDGSDGRRRSSSIVPRDRNGTFEPQIVPKGRDPAGRLRRAGSSVLYARGMTVREIQGHLQEFYGVEVSPDLISRVTDAVLEEVRDGRTGRSTRFIPSSSSTRCG